ncbi:hypothetical protein M9H77_29559 [Catharanthus roseus]|uniref:Uncharacterized protein n=1 Tax=Catharanthus roseus TaxID=4058 RepID=A0ACB9ZW27_CATRO|nr:hypothetical protein M9H77_29559 [Catharanthus roseus]
MGHGDSEYLKYLTRKYMTILHDLQLESSIDDGNDPSHALLLSSLMKDRFDYMFEANEGTRFTKPLKFTLNKPDGETKKYLGSLAKSLQIESQIDDDSDHGMFLDNIRYESADVIYQSKNGVPIEHNGVGFPNYQANDNATSKKYQLKHAIHVETANNSVKLSFSTTFHAFIEFCLLSFSLNLWQKFPI